MLLQLASLICNYHTDALVHVWPSSRQVRAFPEIRIIVECLLLSFQDNFYTISLFLLVNFVFAEIGFHWFGQNDPMHFGTLDRSIVSTWSIETFDDWDGIMFINM